MAGGEVVMRRRNMAYQRQTDYQHLGDFRTPTLNNDQDAPFMMLQQQAEEIGRAMKLAPDSVGISSQLPAPIALQLPGWRSEDHTSELQSLMSNSYAVFCLK